MNAKLRNSLVVLAYRRYPAMQRHLEAVLKAPLTEEQAKIILQHEAELLCFLTDVFLQVRSLPAQADAEPRLADLFEGAT